MAETVHCYVRSSLGESNWPAMGGGALDLRAKAAGAAVHLLTASGAVFGLFALSESAQHNWSGAFIWLGVALIVDGIDGPIARWTNVKQVLPRFSGERMDLVVDYLNYCVVPAFIIVESGLVAERWSTLAAGLILISSLFHFIDQDSKTKDGYFVGFPAIWNIICLYIFVLGLGQKLALLVIVVLALMTFVPITWPHPLRVVGWRLPTYGIAAAWLIAAVIAIHQGFPSSGAIRSVFVAVAVYVVILGVVRAWLKEPLAGGQD
jgi:phosphatidylcholine synthase